MVKGVSKNQHGGRRGPAGSGALASPAGLQKYSKTALCILLVSWGARGGLTGLSVTAETLKMYKMLANRATSRTFCSAFRSDV